MIGRKINGIVGMAFLSVTGGCFQERPARDLTLFEFERSVFSQFGEDGVIERIFQIIEPTHRFAVEFGAGDGVRLSNTRNLFLNHGWGGLLIEGDEALAKRMAEEYESNPRVATEHAWVYPGNVELLFQAQNVPKDLDLLSIDIDSNDYYVWNVIHEYRPKVVLIEFNAEFPPPQRAVIKFHPMNYWDGSTYFGASIQSLYELGKKKGYELVHCESHGANLFFVDSKYYSLFGMRDNTPERLYRGVKLPPDRHLPSEDDLVIEGFTIKKEFIRDLD